MTLGLLHAGEISGQTHGNAAQNERDDPPFPPNKARKPDGNQCQTQPIDSRVPHPQHLRAEARGKTGDYPDDRRCDGRKRRRQGRDTPHPLNVGRSEKYPYKTRHKCHPSRQRRAERGGGQRREPTRMLPRAYEAYKLEHPTSRGCGVSRP